MCVCVRIQLDSGAPVVAYEQLDLEAAGRRVSLRLVLSREGCFRAAVCWEGRPIRGGRFHLVVLSGTYDPGSVAGPGEVTTDSQCHHYAV